MAEAEVKVKISAEISELKDGIAQACEAVREWTDVVERAAEAEDADPFASVAESAEAGEARIEESGGGMGQVFEKTEELAADNFGGFTLEKAFEKTIDFFREMTIGGLEWGETLKNTALATGMTVEQLQTLDYAGKVTGASTERLQMVVDKLARALFELHQPGGSPSLEHTSQLLGVDPATFTDAYDALEKIGSRVRAIGNLSSEQRGALEEFLGGRGGMLLLPATTRLREFDDELGRTGQLIGSEQVEKLDGASEAVNRLSASWQILKNKMAAVVAPPIGAMAEALSSHPDEDLTAILETPGTSSYAGPPTEVGLEAINQFRSAVGPDADKAPQQVKTQLRPGAFERLPDAIRSQFLQTGRSESVEPTEPAETPLYDTKTEFQKELDGFRDSQQLISIEAANTAQARIVSEKSILDFLNPHEKEAASVGIDLSKDIAQARLGVAESESAAGKEAAAALKQQTTEQFGLSVQEARLEAAEAGNTADAKIAAARRVSIAAQGFYGQESKQAREAAVALTDAENAKATQVRDAAVASANDAGKLEQSKLAVVRALINEDESQQIITKQEALSRTAALDEQEYQDKKALYTQLKALYAEDPKELKRVTDEEQVFEQQHATQQINLATQVAEANRKAAEESAAFWRDTLSPITSAFDTAFTGVIQGTQKVSQAFAKMGESIGLESLKSNLQDALFGGKQGTLGGLIYGGGLAGSLGSLFAIPTGANAPGQGSAATGLIGQSPGFGSMRTGLRTVLTEMAGDAVSFGKLILKGLDLIPGFSAVTSGIASLFGSLAGPATAVGTAQKATDEMMVINKASLAAASQFANVITTVPFPENVVLAPAMASEAFAQTMAFGSFELGGVVPHDMMGLLHRDEIVVPTRFTDLVHSGKFGAPQGGDIHYHVNVDHHVHAIDAKSFRDRIDEHSDAVASSVKKAIRDGHEIGRIGG